MNPAARLAKLTARLERVRPAATGNLPVTDLDWLAVFERRLSDGSVASEPDFPRAVEEFRAAITAAGNSLIPPMDFRPRDSASARHLAWKIEHPNPQVESLWFWLAEMFQRALTGQPPVTEAEFADLATWFTANEDRLWAAIQPGQLFELGDGVRVSMAGLRWGQSAFP